MSVQYKSVIVLGWDSKELKILYNENEDSFSKIIDNVNYYYDFYTDKYFIVGKTIYEIEFNSNCLYFDISKTDMEKMEQLAYEEIKKLRNYWVPNEPPKLMHFLYAC